MRTAKPKVNDGSLSIGDIFIEKCSPASETFTLSINGIDLQCKVMTDASEILQMRRAASVFAEDCLGGKLKGELKNWTPTDGEIAARAYMLTRIAVSPKVTQLDALKIAKKCGVAFEMMMQAIDQTCLIEARLAFGQQIELEKKDSSETQPE